MIHKRVRQRGTYYYVYNAQGDVVQLRNAQNAVAANYYNGIKKVFGEKAANSVSKSCNKFFIRTMKKMGVVIYDSGLNGASEAGMFYGMELEELVGYVNLVKMY